MTMVPVVLVAASVMLLGATSAAPASPTVPPSAAVTEVGSVDPSTAVLFPVEEVVARSENLVFAVASADGAVTDRGGREFVLAADVLFAVDRATLTARARAEIARIAGVLIAGTDPAAGPDEAGPKITTVTVTGYTDEVGGNRYNLELSRRRAMAVRQQLVSALGSAVTVTAVGRGEQDPVATNDTKSGRQANRRVEIRGR